MRLYNHAAILGTTDSYKNMISVYEEQSLSAPSQGYGVGLLLGGNGRLTCGQPCQPALFSMKLTHLPLVVFITIPKGLPSVSRALAKAASI